MSSGETTGAGKVNFFPIEDYLFTPASWKELRRGRTPEVSAPLEAKTYLAERDAELHEQLIGVGQKLAENDLPDIRRDADQVRITHLEAEIPEGVEELRRKAYARVSTRFLVA